MLSDARHERTFQMEMICKPNPAGSDLTTESLAKPLKDTLTLVRIRWTDLSVGIEISGNLLLKTEKT